MDLKQLLHERFGHANFRPGQQRIVEDLDMMRAYAELLECRRRYVLNYFGEEYPSDRCDMCDVDRARPLGVPSQPTPFEVGQYVHRAAWGDGRVQRATANAVTVLFERGGYKTLDVGLVLEQSLLELVRPESRTATPR